MYGYVFRVVVLFWCLFFVVNYIILDDLGPFHCPWVSDRVGAFSHVLPGHTVPSSADLTI